MTSRLSIRRSRFVAGWTLVVVQTIAAAGVPLPLSSAASPIAGSPAYPCQGGRCGCGSAEQCWKSCCCHTPSERLAWARQHGVTPPEHLIAAVRAETRPDCGHGCCAARKKSEVRIQKSEVEQPRGSVSLLAAARCRGQSATLHGVPISIVPPLPLVRVSFEPRVERAIVSVTPTSPSASVAPPVPPPRIV